MKRKRYLTDLTNRQWKHIKHLIPPAKPGGRHRTTDLREVVNAVFYTLVTGTQWRLMPHDFPPHSTVYGYFWQWSKNGVWERMNHTLQPSSGNGQDGINIRRRVVWMRKV